MKTFSMTMMLSVLTACGSYTNDTTEPSGFAETEATTAAPTPEAEGCTKLTRTDCMKSAACTLEKAASSKDRDGNYVCRPAEGACEEGVSQFELPGGGTDALTTHELGKAAERVCTDRPGCALSKGDCYCACKGYGKTLVEDGNEAQGCLCVCAGGAPPTCKAG